MNYRIASIIAGRYSVISDDDSVLICTLKGSVKKTKSIMVGDYVEIIDSQIVNIKKRDNFLIRPSISNIDYGVIVSSVAEPVYSKHLILKFITYLNYCNIKPLIVFTKNDIIQNDIEVDTFINELKRIDIKCFKIAKNDYSSFTGFLSGFRNKTFLFFGQTGVGKSSLINAIDPTINRDIGEYSKALNRGKHKTKETIIFKFLNNFLVDSPGFSSLELSIKKDELCNFFPLINQYKSRCFFNDCKHINEPKCSVKKDVEIEEIPKDWYNIYIDLMENLYE